MLSVSSVLTLDLSPYKKKIKHQRINFIYIFYILDKSLSLTFNIILVDLTTSLINYISWSFSSNYFFKSATTEDFNLVI